MPSCIRLSQTLEHLVSRLHPPLAADPRDLDYLRHLTPVTLESEGLSVVNDAARVLVHALVSYPSVPRPAPSQKKKNSKVSFAKTGQFVVQTRIKNPPPQSLCREGCL